MDNSHTSVDVNADALSIATDTPAVLTDGHVKWFDPKRGFGFVFAETHPQDILLHANTLRDVGLSTVADGVRLKVYVENIDGRCKVRKIVSVETEISYIAHEIAESTGLDRECIESLPVLPARVKWLDRAKGYGFVNVFGCAEDVFLHQDVLRAGGVGSYDPGEGIALRMTRSARGLIAVQVLAWDAG